jgi:hypothetical protein
MQGGWSGSRGSAKQPRRPTRTPRVEKSKRGPTLRLSSAAGHASVDCSRPWPGQSWSCLKQECSNVLGSGSNLDRRSQDTRAGLLNDFFRTDWTLAAVGTAVTGVVTYASGLVGSHKKVPAEPLLSISLALMYVPGAYFVAAALSSPLGSRGVMVFAAIVVSEVFAHATYLLTARVVRRRTAAEMTYSEGRLTGEGSYGASVFVSSSPEDYRDLIVPAEANASSIDRIPKRISVMFKGSETVRTIAEQRFGPGSESVGHYVEEHELRTAEFFAALIRGMHCRELYSRSEVEEYVRSRQHGSSVVLSPDHMRDNLIRWRNAIEQQPNYQVAITNERLPFKYEVVDETLVVLHEAIGENDRGRLNAIALESASVAHEFADDFNTMWDRVAPANRSTAFLISWIDNELVPLTKATTTKPEVVAPVKPESGALKRAPTRKKGIPSD